MKFTRYARLTEYAARNWGDLTHREGRVFLCLVIHLNRKTGRCNPTRKAIGEFTGLPKSHTSTAIGGLIAKGWILEGADAFEFGPEFVTDSVTSGDQKVTDSVTIPDEKVTDSVTIPEKKVTHLEKKVTHLDEKVTDSVTHANIAIEQNKQNKNIPPFRATGDDSLKTKSEKVFEYWKKIHEKGGRVTFTKERQKAVIARLKKYSVSDLFDAIDGCRLSPHHQGDNSTGTVYDDLELICRNETKVEAFIQHKLAPAAKRATKGRFSDPGRSDYQDTDPPAAPTCSTCEDRGEVYETPPGEDFEYFRDRRPCPANCAESIERAAA